VKPSRSTCGLPRQLDLCGGIGRNFGGCAPLLTGNLRLQPDLTSQLGDPWDGEISIAKNTIEIVTIRSGPADDSGQQRPERSRR